MQKWRHWEAAGAADSLLALKRESVIGPLAAQRIDASHNRITVAVEDGRERSYDPRRQQGVSVYREQERAFTGDRVQLTAPLRELKLANRELGTVESLTAASSV